MKYFILLLALFFMVQLSCTPTQKTGTTNCSTTGTVKDNSGLDGCKFLIILENGERLEPAEITDKKFKLKDGMNIKFSYELATDMMSICMGGKLVKVTCIEEVEH